MPDSPGLIIEPDRIALPKGWNAISHGQASAGFGGNWLHPQDGSKQGKTA
ncbi:hypothetical protein [Synechococcus sp. CCY9202]|nr:hypothetical protein [Synechococcus sp. CCY9202]MEA5423110.1 hypothetical protein [Synechococcus sp. CCY9202]